MVSQSLGTCLVGGHQSSLHSAVKYLIVRIVVSLSLERAALRAERANKAANLLHNQMHFCLHNYCFHSIRPLDMRHSMIICERGRPTA